MRVPHLFIAICLLAPFPVLAAEGVRVSGQVQIGLASGAKAGDASKVVVWLTPLSPPAASVARRPEPVARVAQKDKRFVPDLIVLPVGGKVEFPNDDPFFHNVFSMYQGRRFDLGLYEAGDKRAVAFDRPGVSYIFCNIHPEMKAVVVALTTTFYAVSDRSGRLEISEVPAGKYRLEVWYERAMPDILRTLARTIDVSGENQSLGPIVIPQVPEVQEHHRNKFDMEYEKPPGQPY